jgi:WD40 repeat protein
MLGARERWAAVAFVLTCACGTRPLEPGADAGTGALPPPDGGTMADGSPPTGDGGTDVVEPPPQPSCPPVDEVADEAPPTAPPPRIPTQVPFSCQPMPGAFFFPSPGADVPGQFSRCASFEVGAATAVTVSPDGRLAALVTTDGLVRVVEIASQQVIAVLASPRAMVDYAAFAPGGRGILTLARGQREVTLWRALDWTPVWRISLPGDRYYHLFGGGVAFSPDGSAAVVSPGSDTFLLDVATGAVRASRTTPYGAVLDVGYGWNGRRVVLVEPSLAAHCIHDPNGGSVVILDADTFATIGGVDYGEYPMVKGQPQFRASPTDDLVLVPDPQFPKEVAALKLSDGSALPAPALKKLPLTFMPDGKTALVYQDRTLVRVAVADAAVTAVVMMGDSGPVAVSADGGVVAFGGKGDGLLRVWNSGAGGGGVQTICRAAEPAATPPAVSLSRDGQRLAIGTSSGGRVLRTVDGATITNLPTVGKPILSPSGEHLVTIPWDTQSPVVVTRTADGALLRQVPQDQSWWGKFAFSPREDRLYVGGNNFGNTEYGLDAVDLSPEGSAAIKTIPLYTALLGVSKGCPVLYQGERGVWRSCGACEEAAIASGGMKYDATVASNAVLSPGGNYVAIAGTPGVTLWRMPPDAGVVGTIGPRRDEAPWNPDERPAAISPDGARMLTGTYVFPSCYSGPAFEAHLHDTASGTLLDALPPAPDAVDGAIRTVAYGAQLWCAR